MPEAPFTACDVEPIHIPGLIQPHGILLALERRAGTLAVIAASTNAGPAPGADTADPAAWLDGAARALLESAMPPGSTGSDQPLGLLRDVHGSAWDATLRRGPSGPALLELEAVADAAGDPRRLLEQLNQGLAAIQQQTGPDAACRAAVAAVSRVSGFDRVMAYRLLADRNGEVIAEALHLDGATMDPAVPASYLGLRFPASDIPVQARALYNSAAVRLIPDARAEPATLLRLDGLDAPVDLSRAVLRGVAPVHLTYLANMGVRASMSIAIRDGRGGLWGLFACHHLRGPLHVGPEIRLASEILARALSWRLAELEAALVGARIGRLRAGLAPVLEAVLEAVPTETEPSAPAPPVSGVPLPDACDAAGIAVCPRTAGLAMRRFGTVPDAALIERLCGWLDEQAAGDAVADDQVADDQAADDQAADDQAGGGRDAAVPADWSLQASDLSALLPPRLASDLAAAEVFGLLAIRLPNAGWLLLLRGELRRVVTWAGNPDKAIAMGPLPLSPRASFEAWRQEVAGLSDAWSEADRAVAQALRDAVGEALLQRAAEIARDNEALRRRSEETRFFADAAAHDLSEPLWQIQVLSELIGEGLEDLPADQPPAPAIMTDLRQMSQSVVASAARMQAMITELSRLAVAGHEADRSQAVSLREVAGEALEDVRRAPLGPPDLAAAALEDGTVDLGGLDRVSVRADRAQVRRVFQNLFSNALKYRDPARRLRVVVEARASGAGIVTVRVADNGLGFDAAHAADLFEPFRRFPNRAAAAPPGLGLGLAICQRIVSAHGGTIEARSPAGSAGTVPETDGDTGACFCFTLVEPDPVALEEQADPPDAARPPGDSS